MECEERLDLGGRPRVPRGASRRAQRLSAGARKKGNRAVEDVRIPTAADGRPRPRTDKHREACSNARGQREVRHTLQKSAVLSEPGHAPEEGSQSVRVRPRALDGAIHHDEQGVSQAGKKRLRNGLLQADEQFGVWQDNGESAKPRGRENCAGVGGKQDPQACLRKLDRFTLFSNDMAGIHMHKRRLVLNTPVYTGMTILDNSKILMYDVYYNHLKFRYGQKCDLIYTDTDSLLLDIQTEDVYKDMKDHS